MHVHVHLHIWCARGLIHGMQLVHVYNMSCIYMHVRILRLYDDRRRRPRIVYIRNHLCVKNAAPCRIVSSQRGLNSSQLPVPMNTASVFALVCCVSATCISAHQIFQHLRFFHQPEFQLYICRIILMVPVRLARWCRSHISPSIAYLSSAWPDVLCRYTPSSLTFRICFLKSEYS